MSKVYEALRQKEHEASASTSSTIRFTPAENLPEGLEAVLFDPELGVADPILRAALVAAEEERVVPHQTLPPTCRPAPVPTSEPQVSVDGFRRLRVAYRENSRLVFQTDPHGLAAEQFRFLRRTLEQKFPNGGALLITSPAPKDGKTLTTLNLCACLADSGRSTLLVEGDIRQPSVHKLLGGTNIAPGIEAALAGAVAPSDAVHLVEELSFYVAMVANPPAEPSRLISGTGPRQFLEWARGQFDWVVIDCPPVLPAADVTQLMPLADAVLAVVRTHSTPRELAVRAFELLGNRLFGVVLNGATIESNPYYRYLSDYRQKNVAPGQREGASEESAKHNSAV